MKMELNIIRHVYFIITHNVNYTIVLFTFNTLNRDYQEYCCWFSF